MLVGIMVVYDYVLHIYVIIDKKQLHLIWRCMIFVSPYGDCRILMDAWTIRALTGLTHWGRVTHICVIKLTIIGSDNGLSPDRRQAVIWTNAGLLWIGPLGTNFSEILIEILTFSFKKMRLKVSSAKRRPFCLGLADMPSHQWNNAIRISTSMIWPYYNDVIMGTMAFQITSLTIAYSTFYSGADERKHQSSASLAFVRGRWQMNSPHKGPVTRKMFPFDDVIMG